MDPARGAGGRMVGTPLDCANAGEVDANIKKSTTSTELSHVTASKPPKSFGTSQKIS